MPAPDVNLQLADIHRRAVDTLYEARDSGKVMHAAAIAVADAVLEVKATQPPHVDTLLNRLDDIDAATPGHGSTTLTTTQIRALLGVR